MEESDTLKSVGWALAALIGQGLPAALLFVVLVAHGSIGPVALVVLMAPSILAWFAASSNRSVGFGISLAILGVALWSAFAYASWRWAQYAKVVRNTIIMRDYGVLLHEYHRQHGVFPASLRDIAPAGQPASARVDAWGNALHYSPRYHGFVLVSFGRDGRPERGLDPWRERENTTYRAVCDDWSADHVLSDRALHRGCGK